MKKNILNFQDSFPDNDFNFLYYGRYSLPSWKHIFCNINFDLHLDF